MSEIEVVVDVRQNPDTAELIIVKQKLVTNGELHKAGLPVETKLGLMTRKAQLIVYGHIDKQKGESLSVRVKSIAVMPFTIDQVAFVCEFESPLGQDTNAIETGRTFDFVPLDPAKKGLLQPGEARDYFLPPQWFETVALTGASLSPSQFWIAAYSGREEVGRVAGKNIRPFFDSAATGIVIHRRAQPQFDTLPDAARFAVITAVAPLRGVDPEHWQQGGIQKLEKLPRMFVIRATPELLVVVTPAANKGVEIMDIVRRETLDQFDKAG